MAGVNLTKWSLHAGGQFVIGLDDDADDDLIGNIISLKRCGTNVMGYLCFRLRDCDSLTVPPLINEPMAHR